MKEYSQLESKLETSILCWKNIPILAEPVKSLVPKTSCSKAMETKMNTRKAIENNKISLTVYTLSQKIQ